MPTQSSFRRGSLCGRRLVVACAALAASASALVIAAPDTHAALAPVVGCRFRLGSISEQGAAGTLYFSLPLTPANPAQRCTTAVNYDASVAPSPGLTATGLYTTVDNNPFQATQTVSFAPGRLPPVLTVAWAGFHCADPAVPGGLTIAAGGSAATIAITPSSCFTMGHSKLEPAALPPSPSEVGIAPTVGDGGFRTVDQNGAFTNAGNASAFTAAPTHSPVVGIAAAPTGNGVWVVATDGGVFSYGTATFHGSLGGVHLNAPVVGMASTPDGHGYWLVAADGGIFSFGSATFHGSLGALHLNAPIVGMAAAPDGRGYWLAGADGGVFAFGSAVFAGSMGSVLLNAPVVGMAAGPHSGYWLVGSDGSVFAFGGAPFEGSLGGRTLVVPVSGMAATFTGHGYWLVDAFNDVIPFGDAHGQRLIAAPV
jgi:hypothetical protein